MNKVTILISTFNDEKSLNKCFESIWNQSFQNFSIICINDSSTDNTSEIINIWNEKFGDHRFTTINNKYNLGLTKSLNKGLAKINTIYTARIDADDWWNEKKLEEQIKFIDQNTDYGIIGCNYINISKEKEFKVKLPEKNTAIKNSIVKKNPFAHSCVLFKTDLIKKIGSYDENIKYGQDYDLWLRAFPHTKFFNIQKFLCYRSTGSGISIEKQSSQMKQCIKTQIKYIKKHNLSTRNYLYTLEPLILILTPNFIKKIKRRILQ